MLPTLEWLKKYSPHSKSILGLRDILDDAEVVCKDWLEKEVYQSLADLYDEIWIYGERDIYDPVAEYRFPVEIHDKVLFTGYIPRAKVPCQKRRKIRSQYCVMEDDLFVLVTPGGGGDGGDMVGIKTIPFHPRLEDVMDAADLVVSMGGYNTICEILSHRTPALIIPRETPRREQLIRAKCLNRLNLIEYIPWHEANPLLLKEKIISLIANRSTYTRAMAAFKLSGLDSIERRIEYFKNQYGKMSLLPEEALATEYVGMAN